ncbi:hypothetical protein [Wansuia hejianensis]|mgnify:CR=1 FL=1|uniref:Uncharacterized protein n=1 Tax=Wansuia hejianensis TaxID=2763667 RepID=A0A7G9GB44_9FIRM|nr:hypothetical protein [Wansuia hejianensis]QNM08026.1 hypothetical protein H9Q79_14190 [Wansuia hejianensis]
MKERMTRKNPQGMGYRVWLDHAGSFRIESQGGELFLLGDLADKLGYLEDEEEKRRKKR